MRGEWGRGSRRKAAGYGKGMEIDRELLSLRSPIYSAFGVSSVEVERLKTLIRWRTHQQVAAKERSSTTQARSPPSLASAPLELSCEEPRLSPP